MQSIYYFSNLKSYNDFLTNNNNIEYLILHLDKNSIPRLPNNIKELTFGNHFNKSLVGITFPNGLKELTFGKHFNQYLIGVKYPKGLEKLTFGEWFNKSLERVTFQDELKELTLV